MTLNNKTLVGIVFGLMMATAVVYFEETREELVEDADMVKGSFFLAVAIAHIPVAFWMLKTPKSSAPYAVMIAGTVGLIILYAVTRTDAGAVALGLDRAGGIGHLGIVSKTIQVGVIVGSIWAWIQARRP